MPDIWAVDTEFLLTELARIRDLAPKAGSLGVRFVFLFSLSKVSPLRIELRAEPHGEDATVKADAIKGRLCEGKLADLVLIDPKT